MLFFIPSSEVSIEFSRSSGPGGQNVNKVASKATARWNVGASRVFDYAQKQRIRQFLHTRLNNNDEIVISSSEERLQTANRNRAIERLNFLISKALMPKKKRKPTKPSKSSKEKRLRQKKHRAATKERRKIGAVD